MPRPWASISATVLGSGQRGAERDLAAPPRGGSRASIKAPPEREDALVASVERAIEVLRASPRAVSVVAIAATVGLSPEALGYYLQVRAILDRIVRQRSDPAGQAARRAAREEELLDRLRREGQRLSALDEPPTRTSLAAVTGVSRSALRRYPRVRAYLEELVGAGRARTGRGHPAHAVSRPAPPPVASDPTPPPSEAAGRGWGSLAATGGRARVDWREDADELYARYAAATDRAVGERLQALWLLRCGMGVEEVAAQVGASRGSVDRWLGWYRSFGLDAVLHRLPGHAAAVRALRLSSAQHDTLLARAAAGDFLTYDDARAWVAERYGVACTARTMYTVLARHGTYLDGEAAGEASAPPQGSDGPRG